MSVELIDLLTEQSAQLTADEQLMLAMRLIDRVRQGAATQPKPSQRKWRDLQGAFAYRLTGEDAQTWVTRTRQEGDKRRELRQR